MRRFEIVVLALALAAGVATSPVRAQVDPGPDAPDRVPEWLPPYEEPDRDLPAEALPYVEPGPEHRALDFLAGRWRISGELSSDPGEAPKRLSGQMESRWILGGRWLEMRGVFDWVGRPIRVHRLLGYDPIRHAYVLFELDNWRLFPQWEEGRIDESGDRLTFVYLSRSPFAPPRPVVLTIERSGDDGYETLTREILASGELELRSRARYERVSDSDG